MKTNKEIYVTAAEANDLYGWNSSSLNTLRSTGKLDNNLCKKEGRKILYPVSVVRKLMPQTRVCATCGEEFKQYRNSDKYCSKKCFNRSDVQQSKNAKRLVALYGDIE